MIYTLIRAYKRTSLDGGYLVSTEPGVPTEKRISGCRGSGSANHFRPVTELQHKGLGHGT